MNQTYETNDIITLNDNDKYIILKVTNINNKTYAYIVNINNKNDDGFVIIENNSIRLLENKKLTNELFMLFKSI